MPVDGRAIDRLMAYAAALATRGLGLGVLAASDADRVLERHILDSLRALRAVWPGDEAACDLGSGGGLPGIPVAVVRPDLHVTLIETRRLRVAWLELMLQELGLANASVMHGRIEEQRIRVDLCMARAFGSLEASWSAARPLLEPGGRLAYFAGEGFRPPEGLPRSREIRVLDDPGLESGGPLVIIAAE